MSQNISKIALSDGREILLSYGVPVAAFVPGRGYVVTDRRYSVTTSKHANGYAGRTATRIPHTDFLALIAPVAGRD